MPAEAADKLTIACDGCQKKLRVPAKAAGKRVKCPKCETVIHVPAASAPPEPEPSPLMSEEEDLLSGLADAERAAAPVAPADLRGDPSAPAPRSLEDQMAGRMKATGGGGAVLAGVGGALKGATGGGLRFVGGCFGSAIGAGIGGVIWLLLMIFTGYEIALVAWLIGLLAGSGMYLISRQHHAVNGLVAVLFSVLAILGARWIPSAMMNFVVGFIEYDIAATVLTDEHFAQTGKTLDPNDPEWEEIYDDKLDDVLEMDRDEVAEIGARGSVNADILKTNYDEIRAEGGGDQDVTGIGTFKFGLFNIVAFFLAISSAYKIGTSGFSS